MNTMKLLVAIVLLSTWLPTHASQAPEKRPTIVIQGKKIDENRFLARVLLNDFAMRIMDRIKKGAAHLPADQQTCEIIKSEGFEPIYREWVSLIPHRPMKLDTWKTQLYLLRRSQLDHKWIPGTAFDTCQDYIRAILFVRPFSTTDWYGNTLSPEVAKRRVGFVTPVAKMWRAMRTRDKAQQEHWSRVIKDAQNPDPNDPDAHDLLDPEFLQSIEKFYKGFVQ